ncbi:MAG: acylphosphatase [ANME-2 cluster archaeon]|nr:acylphosphatase [ANME-2 cluster archaeon]
MQTRAEIIIHGRIQKAGYRDFIDEAAFNLDLTGQVKNLDDGTVQVICEGEKDAIQKLLGMVNISQYPIRVEKIDVRYSEPAGDFKIFEIIRDEDLTTATYERMDTAVRYMREMNTNLGQKIDGVSDKIDGVGVKIDGVGDKIDGVSDKIDGLGDKIDGVSDKIDGVGAKIDDMDKNIGAKIDGVGVKIDGVSDKIDGVGAKIDDMDKNIGDKIEGVGGKIDKLDTNLGNKIDSLGGKIDLNREEITHEIRIMRGELTSYFDERISKIEHELAEIKVKVSVLE